MKISKVKIGILFFIVFIFLIETISFSIYKLRETEKDDIKASKDYIIEDNKSELNEEEQEVLNLTNKYRNENGLEDLEIYSKLQKTAKIKAEDLEKNNYFSHNSPTYGSPFDMLQTFNIPFTAAGENIAKGQTTAQEVMNAWMNSSGHAANILNSGFSEIGVGYVYNNGFPVWTQMFIHP